MCPECKQVKHDNPVTRTHCESFGFVDEDDWREFGMSLL